MGKAQIATQIGGNYRQFMEPEIKQRLPDSFFLMVILHLAWLVMSRNGVKSSDMVDLASILTVCQESSLKINNSPRSVSLTRVIRKSDFCQVGLLDSKTILDIWNHMKIAFLKRLTKRTLLKVLLERKQWKLGFSESKWQNWRWEWCHQPLYRRNHKHYHWLAGHQLCWRWHL